jgi:acetyl-CoA carboxylase biotin carboxylase subunit
MFKKILIANRGEIAVRVIRACREMGISPIAVYSDVDANALHVRLADYAYHIGASPSIESYLSSEKLINVLKESGADAVHPGYGFLSENAKFVQAVEEAGKVFIGPSAKAMEMMGDKIRARQLAKAANAPVVPGTEEPLESLEEAFKVAKEIGYPVMLKAAAGGGGKGMRLVNKEEELTSAYNVARSEASAAFKDATVYLEKYITRPRHIEIQLIADRQGNYVYLGERECSIQRRNQKVVEECPSPINSAELRKKMGEAAVRIAKQAEYYNAGTIEFLADQEHNFYFLEMNTRLQVEHPVTELVTGVDLVKEQIKIAYGMPLSFSQSDIKMHGAAIECRIYAEDAEKNFMPNPGRITRLSPPSGPGIREDSGVYEGFEVPIYYDPLLSKLSVWAATRPEAINRLKRVLDEYAIDGIKTTIPFFKEILKQEDFIKGDLDTGYIQRNWPVKHADPETSDKQNEQNDLENLAALVTAIHNNNNKKTNNETSSNNQKQSAWKLSLRTKGRGI